MAQQTPEQQQYSDEVANQIGYITNMAITRSLEVQREGFDQFKQSVTLEVSRMFETRPVYEVHFKNTEETVKLTQKASKVLPRLLMNAKLGLYTMLVGPAGCGKTTVAHQVAEALQIQFGSVCLTAGASETWLFGRQTPTGFVEGSFSKIYREGGVFLADEMDAADANLLLSINTALSHSEMLNPMNGEKIPKHKDFVFIGAANTNGKGSTHLYTGRARLDAATLDRMVIVKVDYDEELERHLCEDKQIYDYLVDVRRTLRDKGYDEFISTRAFIAFSKQFKSGVPMKEIKDSLIMNWGEAAQSVANDKFIRFSGPKAKGGAGGEYYELANKAFPDMAGRVQLTWN